MIFFKLSFVACLGFIATMVSGQHETDSFSKGKNDSIRVAVTLLDGELIPWVALHEVPIVDKRIYKSAIDLAKFKRLKRDVLKVMPYAILARERYAKLQRDLAVTSNKKEQHLLVNICNDEIKTMFNREVKNFTINQGGVLIKLIDREVGISSYAILKELKGRLNAFFYQSIARAFGNNLKSRYDPGEDRDIEMIIQSSNYK